MKGWIAFKDQRSYYNGTTETYEVIRCPFYIPPRKGREQDIEVRLMKGNLKKVQKLLDKPELLCQLAEDCAGLSRAALRLRRTMRLKNPTLLTEAEAWAALTEEVADVMAVLKTLNIPTDDAVIQEIQEYKFRRWVRRLEGRKE